MEVRLMNPIRPKEATPHIEGYAPDLIQQGNFYSQLLHTPPETVMLKVNPASKKRFKLHATGIADIQGGVRVENFYVNVDQKEDKPGWEVATATELPDFHSNLKVEYRADGGKRSMLTIVKIFPGNLNLAIN